MASGTRNPDEGCPLGRISRHPVRAEQEKDVAVRPRLPSSDLSAQAIAVHHPSRVNTASSNPAASGGPNSRARSPRETGRGAPTPNSATSTTPLQGGAKASASQRAACGPTGWGCKSASPSSTQPSLLKHRRRWGVSWLPPGLFNYGRICWIRFVPQQYTL
jgi:hypothetical protein